MTLILSRNLYRNFFTVGEPIDVKQVAEPSNEEIDELHSKYLKALKDLYNKYNPVYGDPRVQLNFM